MRESLDILNAELEELGGVDLDVPERYAAHELIRGKIFYTLPFALLKELEKALGKKAFDQDLFEMDYALANQLQQIPSYVAFDRGNAIRYELLPLRPTPVPQLDATQLKHLDESKRPKVLARYRMFRGVFVTRLSFYWEAKRAYVGWLVTCRQFLDERDQLLAKWKRQLAKYGCPQSGSTSFGQVLPGKRFVHITANRDKQFFDAFAEFHARWRLMHLVTPELPEPLSPQMPVVTPLSLLTHMQAGGVTLYQPDTMPIPSRDMLRDVLSDIRASHKAEHLRDWLQIVPKSHRSNRPLSRYGRILVLRHYWAVLEARYPDMVKRRGAIAKLQMAFAGYLGVDEATVVKYRYVTRRRLRRTRSTSTS